MQYVVECNEIKTLFIHTSSVKVLPDPLGIGQLLIIHLFCSVRGPVQVYPPLVGVGFAQDRCRID